MKHKSPALFQELYTAVIEKLSKVPTSCTGYCLISFLDADNKFLIITLVQRLFPSLAYFAQSSFIKKNLTSCNSRQLVNVFCNSI